MNRVLSFDGFQVLASSDWNDITDSVDSPDRPFTMAKENGVGALRFSPALYRSGRLPLPAKDDLLSMAVSFGKNRGLGKPFDADCFESSLLGGAVSYLSDGDLVRVWYVSDGRNIMLATYVCRWEYRHLELTECETIIRTLCFREEKK